MADDDLPRAIRDLCATPLEPIPTGSAARLDSLTGIRAVLFDIYGTLLISSTGDIGMHVESAQEEALRRALAGSGFTGVSGDAARRGVVLLTDAIRAAHARRRSEGVDSPEVEIREIWRAVLAALRDEGLIGCTPSDARLERFAIEYECRANPVWPMPGARATLEELASRGFVLGIVSNAQFYTPLTLEALFRRSLRELGFAPDVCCWSFEELTAKPSVGLYRTALDRLRSLAGVHASETVYVGNDMLKDVWAASEAGCRTALFAGDARSLRRREDDPRTRALEPDLVLTTLEQLPGCLA